MRRYLDLSSWIILFALLPVSLLAFLSQNAVPGELFYPVKRGLENVVLVASSVHPATKVAFRTDLTERRFSEAQSLLVLQGQTTGLTEFVSDFQVIEQELAQISSFEDKKELSDNLIAKINEYETKLVAVQTAVEQAPTTTQPFEPTPVPQQSTPTPFQQIPTESPLPTPVGQTPTPTPFQTPAPTPFAPSTTPRETTIPIPSEIPSEPVPIAAPITSEDKEKAKEEIGKAKRELEKLKERLKKEQEEAEVQKKIREESKKQFELLEEQNRE